MTESELVKYTKRYLIRILIGVAVTFLGTLALTVFNVRSQEKDIESLKDQKADKSHVESEFNNINRQLDEIQEDIREGQRTIVQILRNNKPD